MAKPEMSRAEAIDHIIGLELTVANDRYVTQSEHDEGNEKRVRHEC